MSTIEWVCFACLSAGVAWLSVAVSAVRWQYRLIRATFMGFNDRLKALETGRDDDATRVATKQAEYAAVVAKRLVEIEGRLDAIEERIADVTFDEADAHRKAAVAKAERQGLESDRGH